MSKASSQLHSSQFSEPVFLHQESWGARIVRVLRSIWPFIVLAIVQTVIALISMQLLHTLRALSAGESQWSKGHKDATMALNHYINTSDPVYYQTFITSIQVPLSDNLARHLLESESDLLDQEISQLLIQGRNEPADIKNLIWLFRNFGETSMVSSLLEKWRDSDPALLALQAQGNTINNAFIENGTPSAAQKQEWLAQVRDIQTQLSQKEQIFSTLLGDASRTLKGVLWWINISGALAILALFIWYLTRWQHNAAQAENALDVVSERASTTLAAIGDAVITTNASGDVLYMNRAAESLLGTRLERMLMRSLPDQLSTPPAEDDTPSIQAAIVDALTGTPPDQRTIFTVYDSHRRARQVKLACTLLNAHTGTNEAVFVLHDVSKEQTYIREMAWQATHDQLTGLVNRYEFEHRLSLLLSQNNRDETQCGAMLYLDLDQFKVINDTSGHSAGDAMLRAMSTMLQQNLHLEDTLARVGGDEFAILLERTTFAHAQEIAEQIRDAAQHLRIQWGERNISSSVSIGVLKLRPSVTSVEEVFRLADMASWGAKQRGRNTVYAYDPSVDDELARYAGEMEWVERIKTALENNQFILHAQPIVALNPVADRLAGGGLHVEIQLRMRMPDGSLISPIHFIPAAERYGLMPLVDRWVVNKTLETLAAIQKAWQVMPITCCAINLSGTTLGEERLLDFLRYHIELHNIDPQILCFEITETAAISNLPNAIRLIKALKTQGCKFSLDDFGAGVSSFGSLKNLPVDYLKMDGAIVADIIREPAHRSMVEAINHLGHALGMHTIAEFAATPEIVDMLATIGVDYAQGYAAGAPKPFIVPERLADGALFDSSDNVKLPFYPHFQPALVA